MPVIAEDDGPSDSGLDAFEALEDVLKVPGFGPRVGARKADLAFLNDFMNDPVIQSLVAAHDALEGAVLEPEQSDINDSVDQLLSDLDNKSHLLPAARELRQILCDPHVRALLDAHDQVAANDYGDEVELVPIEAVRLGSDPASEEDKRAIQMVTIRKSDTEPLGMTVTRDMNGNLIIRRIIEGGFVHKQGLINVGDVIKEVNGEAIRDPELLMDCITKSNDTITFKLIPSYWDNSYNAQMFLKAHFTYNPLSDNLIPSREAGLKFKEGDILMVVNMDDPSWWQAKKLDDQKLSGLIPSRTLEEKRQAFVPPEYDYTHTSLLCGLVTKKKKKMTYKLQQSSAFDNTDLVIYQEVAKMPPFRRKTLVLIGAQGIGRRSIKSRLTKVDPRQFGQIIPYTSRLPRPGEVDGDTYYFVSRIQMEREVGLNMYLEHGVLEDCLYGTKFDSIRQVIVQNRMCVLDLNPTAIKAINRAEFSPLIVFLAAPPVDILRNMYHFALANNRNVKPKTEQDFKDTVVESERIERKYRGFFDVILVNDNMENTYQKLRKTIDEFNTTPQWVPVGWVYEEDDMSGRR